MRILPYIAVMFTLLLAACSGEADKVAKEKMEIAHTLVSQNPDSAMSVLEGKPYGLIVYTHAYYVKNKHISDSLSQLVYEKYINEENGSRCDLIKAKLFYGIKLFYEKNYIKALSFLLDVNNNLENLESTYLKAVACFYIGSLYMRMDLYEEALSAFCEELDYALRMNSGQHVARAYSHVAIPFERMGLRDSALFYTAKAIKFEEVLDSQMRATLYNNYAIFKKNPKKSHDREVELYLKKAYDFKGQREYSTLANLAELYYEQDKIKEGDSISNVLLNTPKLKNGTMLILTRALYNRYTKTYQVDSAHKYHLLYLKYDSIENNMSQQNDVLKLRLQDQYEKLQDRNRLRYALAILSSLFIIAFVFIAYRKKLVLAKKDNRLNKEKILDYTDKIEDLEQQIEVLNKSIKAADIKAKEKTSSIIGEKLLSLPIFDYKNTKLYYDTIIATFCKHDEKFSNLKESLPEMTSRSLAMSFMFFYGKFDENKMMELLDFKSKQSYRTAKSRLKKVVVSSPVKNAHIEKLLANMS